MTNASEAARALLESMSSTSSGNMRWDCPADGCYVPHIPDWSPFNGCFPRDGIRISDIDGMVEVGNHFLFIEWKMPKATVPEGQLKALTRLTRLPGITVLIVWGKTTTTPECWQVIHGGEVPGASTVDHDALLRFITEWATSADTNPQPRPTASPPRPSEPGRTGANRVPTLRPGPFRDAGDAGRATPRTTLGDRYFHNDRDALRDAPADAAREILRKAERTAVQKLEEAFCDNHNEEQQ